MSSAAAAVARQERAHHRSLLSLFSSASPRRSAPISPPRAPFVGIDLDREAVIQGRVVRGDAPVARAYVRLLDSRGGFVAEVPTSSDGTFRFYAEPRDWTLRVDAGGEVAHLPVTAARGAVVDVVVTI